MTTQRIYSSSDVDMLTAAATIVDYAVENKEFLTGKRSAWADPFFPDLKETIDKAFREILGVDNVGELRRSTAALRTTGKKAKELISDFKVQVKEDLKNDKNRRNEVLSLLGFMSGGQAVKINNLDQQKFSELLQTVKNRLTPELQTEIKDKGVDETIMTDLIAVADEYYQLNVAQETLKGTSKTLTAESVQKLNDIYGQASSVAKIARTFLKGRSGVDKSKFSFKSVLRQQGIMRSKTTPAPEQESM